MKTFRHKGGLFEERPFYEAHEIEETCYGELRKVGLYPTTPSPVRIERFIEKRFGVSASYEELPDGFLGYSRFGSKGLEALVVSRALIEDESNSARRRVATTLAHEVGHALLHAHLFALGAPHPRLFGDEVTVPKILCRCESVAGQSPERKYDGRWWEYQANQAIGPLLLPRELVNKALEPILQSTGMLKISKTIPIQDLGKAIDLLSETFEVNPAVSRIRVAELYPANGGQLTL